MVVMFYFLVLGRIGAFSYSYKLFEVWSSLQPPLHKAFGKLGDGFLEVSHSPMSTHMPLEE